MEKDLHIPMAFKERTCMHYENDISEYNVNPRIFLFVGKMKILLHLKEKVIIFKYFT